MRHFETYHPIVIFTFFAGAVFISMFTAHPVVIAVCYLSGVIFCGMLSGVKKLLASLAYSLPLTVVIAFLNPIFVHKGETILFFLNDNPVTLEAVYRGAASGVMLMSVFYWFKCYNAVMTSDKFIYLFGRAAPKLSLLISMILRFIPKLIEQYKEIDCVQRAMGIYISKSYADKLRSKFRVFSALVSWSLENSIETADSMRARGYGLKGRTSYSDFFWRRRDTAMMTLTACLLILTLSLTGAGYADFLYYPSVSAVEWGGLNAVCYLAVFVLLFFGTAMEIKENIKWKYLKSKIDG
jgi:energy-coupling factor transport system permease protein